MMDSPLLLFSSSVLTAHLPLTRGAMSEKSLQGFPRTWSKVRHGLARFPFLVEFTMYTLRLPC